MATTGIVNGSLICIYVEGVKVAYLLSNSSSKSRATRKTSNKDSGQFETSLAGLISTGYECNGLMVEGSSYVTLYDLFIAGDSVTVMESSGVTGDIKYSQEAIITKLDRDNPHQENSTFSVSFEGTGDITKATI